MDGLVLGLQYGLLGVGLTLIYGLAGVVNLAHGQIAVMGAIVVSLAMDSGIPTVPSVAIGLVAAAVFMVVIDRTVMRAVYRQEGESRILLGLLIMLGISFVIDGFLEWQYPIQQLGLRFDGQPVPVLGVPMSTGSMVATAVTVVVGLALVFFFRSTSLGRGVRSVIQDEQGAKLVGIDPARVRTFVFGLSGVLAALVAVTRAMTGPVGVSSTISFTILALIVAVVGGLGSVSGAFAAGVLLGVVDRLSSFYIGTYVTTIILLVCAAITIVVRPAGLFGRRH